MMSKEIQNFHITIRQGIMWYNLEKYKQFKIDKYFILDMACPLQPECNFVHGFFRCKLPVEVVDIEVKVTSMQGMHIFRKDRTTQLIRYIPWTMKLHLYPTIVKKMKTFLEMGKQNGTNNPSTG